MLFYFCVCTEGRNHQAGADEAQKGECILNAVLLTYFRRVYVLIRRGDGSLVFWLVTVTSGNQPQKIIFVNHVGIFVEMKHLVGIFVM